MKNIKDNPVSLFDFELSYEYGVIMPHLIKKDNNIMRVYSL